MSSDSIVERLYRAEEIRGTWQLPDAHDTSLPGMLSLDRNGQMKLTVDRQVSFIEGMQSVLSFERKSIPIILGVLEGSFCTLQGLTLIETTSFGSLLTEVFFVSAAIFGVHIDSFTEFKVRNITVSLPILMDWSKTSWCSDLNSHPKGLTLQPFGSRELPLGKAGNITGEICVRGGFSFDVIPSRSLSMQQGSFLTISFSEHVSLEDARKTLPLIGEFLSLMTLSAIQIPFFSCTSEEAKDMLPTGDGQEKPYYRPMMVWYYGMTEGAPYSGLSCDDMLLTYVDLKEANLVDALVRILAQPEEYDLLLPLLVPETGSFHSYSKWRFLDAAQSLEYLHRRTSSNDVLSPEEFLVKRSRILAAVAEEDRSWLTERLQRSNEPSLLYRISSIIDTNAELLQTTVDQQSSFVKSVRDTRNVLIHLDSRRRNDAVNGLELINATDKLEALARISFLREIGFDEQGLEKLFSTTERPYVKHVRELFRSQN
ncbi:hypothetical protein SMC3_08950 [Candidatus Cryosericum hinesii]|jgi:hypothetical protein|uniref:Uncharacterized protein n=2 Tax=Candidatus Cryosericum TaxID=2498709 RepID=A0A398D953_9BACT|nr:HEPN domain-containing protein [Candidatus Cryosericum hinesii]RIE09261.1 hypothetical protein SMC4_05425 [Candidatus Cryosericum hinesii]RIE11585.1 hypothetical protein SMC3_08950 [Candidatus Cryosericum hinesii]RIE15414.1 hypothetical protein SMC2_00895 [Candidatus Cryosericum hinesii]